MRSFFSFVLLILIQSSLAQVTFVINELPETHDFNEDVFITGNFEGWTGGNETYKLIKLDNQYSITLSKDKACNVLFKFTKGSWETEELDAKGNKIENRNYNCIDEPEIIFISIKNWAPMDSVVSSSASKNVEIVSDTFQMPQLNRKRKIWIYLPPDYKNARAKFPVLYMHDAQNLFDAKTSYAGEWNVDETLNSLFYETGFQAIVVGIENGGDKRLDEYSPWINNKYGGGEGDDYLDFIVSTLKPFIDANYKTLTDKENTAIFGSSMGGLISHYAALKYSKIFGKIGVYSPAFWFAPEINEYSKENGDVQNTKIYFLAGGKEGKDAGFNEISQTVKDMNNMIAVLKEAGFPANNINSKVIPNGIHNEKLWRDNFEEAITWLFPEAKEEREFKSLIQTETGLKINVSDGQYILTFFSSDIIETTFIPFGEELDSESHAVVLNPQSLNIVQKSKSNKTIFSTIGINVEIQKNPFKISYSYQGRPVISEKKGFYKTEYGEAISLELESDEILYGGGSRALGMNRRGHKLHLYNKAHYGYETESELMNYTMPIAISSKRYMLHFDNAPIGYLDLDSQDENTLTYETISGRKTYQLIVGDSWEKLIDNYTDLTGKQPMLPRWALGNFSSRFGYHSQSETERTIEEFKKHSIPVDAIILDLYWFGKDIQGTMGNLEVYRDSFPDFEGMVRRLKDKGVKTIPITEPFILSTSKRWDEAVENQILATDSLGQAARYDFYFGNTGLIDIYKEEAEDWFWNIYKDLANKGVAGFWGDLGEPELHPSWVQHHTGTADEVHNTYGHDWSRLVYEGYEQDFPGQRPFILMRAGYSGSQRYGMVPWSGDVNRTWGGLQSQTEISLQMGLQGLGYMHSDLGGFAGANLDDELYTRWLQYGVFQPIFRPHAQEEVASEPVYRESKTRDLAKKSIELRYQLLPYNYNLVFENSQKGMPLMRPLFYEEESDKTFNEAFTYFWGKDFLVTPIMESGLTEKEVYFPKSNVWFDFYTDEAIEGGQTKTVATTKTSIPTYVRSGAFIPITNVVQSTEDYTLNDFDLHYYYHDSVTESKRTFYNDDGTTKDAYIKGQYELLEFKADVDNNKLEIEFIAEIGTHHKSDKKNIDLIVHNIETEPSRVKVGGKNFRKFKFNKEKSKVIIPVTWNTYKELNINITLKK